MTAAEHRSKHARRLSGAGLAFALLLALSGCAGGLGSVDVALTRDVPVDRQVALSSLNAFRAENGLPALVFNPILGEVAERQARAMAARGDLSHSVDGTLPERVRSYGYDVYAAAENIGWNYRSVPAVMDGWKNSAGHRKNLLNPRVREIGFAAAEGPNGEPYWALVLAARE
ncbi:CAP domain-containing protein [Jiella sonneratiae]|uniref:CAP domain-containing protein n=1 Tax=Jiella sonneratiae TaxID=2816856 RepID=A0ABS3J1L9_9HYPH|nr:CAP domain-containing protein [Jiella sonneratiae]MBO0903552.1 CAP domain-containing protein [Jiella sonneratiae]